MSRTIKFKIWDTYSKKMWNENRGISLAGLATSYREIVLEPEVFTLLQFTGLLDKNGKEIYEGDILRYSPDYEESQGGVIGDDLDAVYFKDGCFWVDDQWLYDHNEINEVVGNIFENPELLEQ